MHVNDRVAIVEILKIFLLPFSELSFFPRNVTCRHFLSYINYSCFDC